MARVWQLLIRARGDTSEAQFAMRRLGKDVTKHGHKMRNTGRTLTRNLTLPILGVGAASLYSAAKFDKSFTESTSMMENLSPKMREEMRLTALQMAKGSKFSASELSEAYYFLASAGMSAEQQIRALGPSQQFATAGAFDLSRSVDILTDAQTALGLSMKDPIKNEQMMIMLSDQIVAATQNANASVDQFGSALITKAAPAMKSFGIKSEDGIAVLAAFADAGLKGESAGTAYASMMTGLTNAADKNSEAFEKHGIAVFDAQGKLRKMPDIMDDYAKATKGKSEAEKVAMTQEMKLNRLTLTGMRLLEGQSDKMRKYTGLIRESGGATERMAKKQMGAFSNRLKAVKNTLEVTGITFGNILIPYIEKAAMWVARMAEKLDGLSNQRQKMIVLGAVIVAAIGPILVIMGSLTIAVGAVITALAGVSVPVLAAGAALVALAAYLAGAYAKNKEFRIEVNKGMRTVSSAFRKAQPFITAFLRIWVASMKMMVMTVASNIKMAVRIIMGIGRMIAGFYSLIRGLILTPWITLFRVLIALFTGRWREIPKIFKDGVKSAADQVLQGGGAMLRGGYEIGKAMVQGIVDAIKNGAQFIKTAMSNLAGDAVKAAKDRLKIKSPSRVFADEVGIPIAEGVAMGIRAGMTTSINAAQSLADKLVKVAERTRERANKLAEIAKKTKDKAKKMLAETAALKAKNIALRDEKAAAKATKAANRLQAHYDGLQAKLDRITGRDTAKQSFLNLRTALDGGIESLDTMKERMSSMKSTYAKLDKFLKDNAKKLTLDDRVGVMDQMTSLLNDIRDVEGKIAAEVSEPVVAAGAASKGVAQSVQQQRQASLQNQPATVVNQTVHTNASDVESVAQRVAFLLKSGLVRV